MSSRCPDGQPTPVSPSFPARRSRLDRCVRARRPHSLRLERCERCPGRIDTEPKRPMVVAKLLVAAAAWLTSTFLLRRQRNLKPSSSYFANLKGAHWHTRLSTLAQGPSALGGRPRTRPSHSGPHGHSGNLNAVCTPGSDSESEALARWQPERVESCAVMPARGFASCFTQVP